MESIIRDKMKRRNEDCSVRNDYNLIVLCLFLFHTRIYRICRHTQTILQTLAMCILLYFNWGM